MMANLPSPGASCGSPYSDVTSGDYSDSFEPLSPDFTIDSLRSEFSVQAHLGVVEATSPTFSHHEDDVVALRGAEKEFYENMVIGSDTSIDMHIKHVMIKFSAGLVNLPSRKVDPNSLTPYSDVAKPKKRGKDGCVKRPMNAFMAFAQFERKALMQVRPTLHNAVISKHLGSVWKRLSMAVKHPFVQHAEWLKELHKLEFPDYKYRPQKKKTPGPGSAEPTVPAKVKGAARAAKPRSRARKAAAKPYGAREVPDFVTDMPESAASPAYSDQLYSEPTLEDAQPFPLDVSQMPIYINVHKDSVASDDGLAQLHDELPDPSLDISPFDEQSFPLLQHSSPLLDCGDVYGFFLPSEDLVQGDQLLEALDYPTKLDLLLPPSVSSLN